MFAVAFRGAFPIVSRFGSWWCGKQDKLTSHSESISSAEKYRVGSVGDQMFSRGGERRVSTLFRIQLPSRVPST